jgi:hypothetical protein
LLFVEGGPLLLASASVKIDLGLGVFGRLAENKEVTLF